MGACGHFLPTNNDGFVYSQNHEDESELHHVVIVDKLHWIFMVRADKIKPLFTPKV
jgi:hypothetical protein